MAGDIKFELGVAIEGAMRNLDAFAKKVEKISKDFDDISGKISNFATVGTAALTGLAVAAASFADELADVAAANETTISNVLGLASAMQEVGGKADSAGKLLQTLNNNIESASSGNLKMANTFAKLGIGINELATMSQDEIRGKLIENIAAIKDPVERSAKAFEVFGKAAQGMDFTKLGSEIADNTAKYKQYEETIKLASDAFGAMEKIIKDLKIAATVAFEPLFKYIKNLKIDIDTLVVGIRIFAAAIAAAVSVSVLAGFAKLIGLVKTLTVVARANPLIAIASAALGIATAIGVWSEATADVETATADAKTEVDKVEKATGAVKNNVEGLADAQQKQLDTLKQVTQNFNRQLEAIQDKLKLEGQTLKLSEDQKKIAEQIAAIETNKQNTLISLQQKFDALDSAAQGRTKSAYETQKKLIIDNAEAAKRAAESQIQQNQDYVNSLRNIGNAMAALNSGREQVFDIQARNQMALSGTQERIVLEERYNSIIRMRQALINATAGLGEKDKKEALQAISISTTRIQNQTISSDKLNKSIESHIQLMVKQGKMSETAADAIIKNSQAERESVLATSQEILETNQQISNQSRSFGVGWAKAFTDYVDSATNAANAAQSIFRRATQGMEDMMVDFAKTGKLEWKGFVASMLEELLRSQLRSVMAQLFTMNKGGVMGGGSLLGNLLGFANGGIIPTNQPVLVGERGPEILSGVGGRTVIPNAQLGGSTMVTYNISAVDAASFKSLVARDPSFIHAVAMQGSKGTAARR